MTFAISSPSFSNGGKIPTKFTCDGTDVSPELTWTALPPGTQSFTVIAEDPDAPVGTWTHWLLFNLSARVATPSAKSAMVVPARLPANGIATSSNSMLWTECSA